jgi:hypothetical protein
MLDIILSALVFAALIPLTNAAIVDFIDLKKGR